jgi:hypothetical protein
MDQSNIKNATVCSVAFLRESGPVQRLDTARPVFRELQHSAKPSPRVFHSESPLSFQLHHSSSECHIQNLSFAVSSYLLTTLEIT